MKSALLVLGYLWSGPLTLAGLALARIGGTSPVHNEQGLLICFADKGGLLDVLFFKRRPTILAFTWGAVCIVRSSTDPQFNKPWGLLVTHERQHMLQAMVLGPLFPFAYGLASLVAYAKGQRAYRDNWFEAAAYAAEAFSFLPKKHS